MFQDIFSLHKEKVVASEICQIRTSLNKLKHKHDQNSLTTLLAKCISPELHGEKQFSIIYKKVRIRQESPASI